MGSFREKDAGRKCDLAGDPYSHKRPFAKAMQACQYGRTGRISDATGLSQRTIETWQNPTDPQRGPNQTLAIVMHESLAAGASEEEALAPLFHLADEFGFTLEFQPREDGKRKGIEIANADTLDSAADLVSALIRAMEDRRITAAELAVLETKVDRLTFRTQKLLNEARAMALPELVRGKRFK